MFRSSAKAFFLPTRNGKRFLAWFFLCLNIPFFSAVCAAQNNKNQGMNEAPIFENSKNAADVKFDQPQSGWPIQLMSKSVELKPTESLLKARLKAVGAENEAAEPIVMRVLKSPLESSLLTIGKSEKLGTVLSKIVPRVSDQKLSLTASDLDWLDLTKLSHVLKVNSYQAEFSKSDWIEMRQSQEMRLRDFFGESWPEVSNQVGEFLRANPDASQVSLLQLIPARIRSLYGKFSYLRGRNCFGTALEFHDSRFFLNKYINTQTEKDHFRTMINSDEFSQAVWLGFQEYDPVKSGQKLAYGDLIVFIDRASEPGYIQLKHAAVHLAGNYFFQKQSKSASSPIEITNWESMVRLWSQHSKDLGVRFYRRKPEVQSHYANGQNRMDILEWTNGLTTDTN